MLREEYLTLEDVSDILDIIERRDDAAVLASVCSVHQSLHRHCAWRERTKCKMKFVDLTWDELLQYYLDHLDARFSG